MGSICLMFFILISFLLRMMNNNSDEKDRRAAFMRVILDSTLSKKEKNQKVQMLLNPINSERTEKRQFK